MICRIWGYFVGDFVISLNIFYLFGILWAKIIIRSVLKTFAHHWDDQEAKEHPLSGDLDDLEDLGYIDGDFVIFTVHMIHFWNS